MSDRKMCDKCGRGFRSQEALDRHTGWHNRGELEKQPAVKAGGYIHCPVCGVESSYPLGFQSIYPTVCNNCLCMFTFASGQVTQAPPIKCAAEQMGYPCPRPSHISWGKAYAERAAQQSKLTAGIGGRL